MTVRVCLVLEGTYPYIKGGVSSCVAQLISLLPNVSFSLVFIGVTRHKMQRIQYRLPQKRHGPAGNFPLRRNARGTGADATP